MKKTFKITPSLQKRIADEAKKLPPMARTNAAGEVMYRDAVVKGSELTERDLKPGTPLHRDASYKIKKLVYEDHVQNMIRLVQRDGESAISAYVGGVNYQFSRFAKTADRAMPPLTRLKNRIQSFFKKIKYEVSNRTKTA